MTMITNVGRRSVEDPEAGRLLAIGDSSLNGYESNCLWENDGTGRFEEVGYQRGCDLIQDGRGIVAFDHDLDGDLDLYVTNYRRRGVLLRNDTAGCHWLQVKLIGTTSNRDAVGARLELEAGGRRQLREVRIGESHLSASTLVQHFGLGAADRVDRLEIRWPSGFVQRVGVPEIDRRIVVVEPTVAGTDEP